MTEFLNLKISPNYSKYLPADKQETNNRRQVHDACFSFVNTKMPSNPSLIHASTMVLKDLKFNLGNKKEALKVLSGQQTFPGFRSYAMCYGGHQFGQWAGQLGDGRAINIAELECNGENWTFQLKGAGPTPYSRNADGLAVLRSSIREYLCSEAMHALGVPTTRALSLALTGDKVVRDILYDGNPAQELGAVVCRVSPSFIRFGSFEIFAARQEHKTLKQIVDYTINQHYSELGSPSKDTYVSFFNAVVKRTKEMVLNWQRVGFVHGVMNTDNMSILGLTIDYGPYGWLEGYDEGWTPNTTDAQHKRYRYGNQPSVALWNLVQLANALFPLIEDAEPLQNILDTFRSEYLRDYHKMMCEKLGLYQFDIVEETFITELTKQMQLGEIDLTLFFRELSTVKLETFEIFWKIIKRTTYLSVDAIEERKGQWEQWFKTYDSLLKAEGIAAVMRHNKMKQINPKYVLRNYMAQLAIEDAEKGNYSLINELYELLSKPYDEQPEYVKWYAKRPDWAKHKIGSSQLSCSS
ncbi:MAG: YdiU family protein [Putridiphycobacter sp.]|nr:YdiU family protein [Putridiphycobacter sp.]